MKTDKRKIILLIMGMILVYMQLPVYAQKPKQQTKKTSSITNVAKKPIKKQTASVASSISEPTGYINDHGYVDLGLSVKWATCNVGASFPSDYGSYFAWGEVEPKRYYAFKNSISQAKSFKQLESESIIDSKGNLKRTNDAACSNWGHNWRMPTKEECQEIIDKCTWVWISQNGTKGYKLTGPNGNSIFLPASGYRFGDDLFDKGKEGYIMSSSLCLNGVRNAYFIGFDEYQHIIDDADRHIGCPVRPVIEHNGN